MDASTPEETDPAAPLTARAAALNNRALTLRASGRVEAAAEALRRAVEYDPASIHPRANLAATYLMLGRPLDALAMAEAALRSAPDAAELLNLVGGVLLALDRPSEAEASFRRALAAHPEHFQAKFGLAMALLSLGRWSEGFGHYEARWDDAGFRADEPVRDAPLWDGVAPLDGRTILLHAEQGLGDTLMTARFVPVLRARGARVVMAVQAPLLRLLAPLADAVVARDEAAPPHDLRAPMLSLPRLLQATPDGIVGMPPYLHATPADHMRGPGRNVGLVLCGSPDHPEDAVRSIPAALCGPLRHVAGVTWHLLQPDVRAGDVAALAEWDELRRYDDGSLADFDDTARVVSAMDLVVSADTALAHLAGALGRPLWLLVQRAADWRWVRERTDTAWYPSAQLFRQDTSRDWRPVLASVAAALGAWPAAKTPAAATGGPATPTTRPRQGRGS